MRFYIISIIILLAIAATLSAIVLRKDLPYQFDIIQKKDGLAVVNQDVWNQRPLTVTISQNGREFTKGTIDPADHSQLFTNLPDSGPMNIEISRDDLIGRLRYRTRTISFQRTPKDQAYVILLGASIGRAWKLDGFAQRINEDEVVFSTRAHYDFDKTGTLMPLLNLKIKPDAIIIKQCSDYFPRDFKKSADTVRQWVVEIKQSGIRPILATTVPVTGTGPRKERQASIDQWNHFVRELGQKIRIPVLDLADAVQISEKNTFLKENFAQEDGYHLTMAAYDKALDPLLKKFTEEELHLYY